MLPLVKTPVQKLEKYRGIISDKLFNEIKELSQDFKGLKVVMINSTPRGGGVAEVLKSLVPLMKGVGIQAEWYTIPLRENFFETTKKMHNALQGKDYDFPFSARRRYLHHMEETAKLMQDMKADIWVIHDPQPAGVTIFLSNFHPSICHLHIDLTSPNREVWDFVAGFLESYDKVILSLKEYIKPEIKNEAVIFPPAIDPLASKNQPLSLTTSKQILKSFEINPQNPLVTQIFRFDPWKDPIGSIQAYRIAKKKIPNLQLALVGLFLAYDDPEAMKVFKEVIKETKGDPDIHLFSNPDQLGSLRVDRFVNACQTGSDAVLQKSIREGFGLTVSEAMWKGKAVIGGKVGGIKLQIQNGQNGFLVSSPKEAAKRIVQLIRNPQLAKKLGKAARETVRENFLTPRLLKDYLKLFREIT